MEKRLFITEDGGYWKLHWENEASGDRYFSEGTAIIGARARVTSMGKGTISQIVVQKANGERRIEWTYGKDKFPPGT
jgi:hypothetical protein